MIKDKITIPIKDKFREALKRTIQTGNEHGFLICKDENGNLHSREICTGVECTIKNESPENCPYIAQGTFHTHPDVSNVMKLTENKIPREIITLYVKDKAKSLNEDITTPSQRDLINALVNKCKNRSEGTVCVASDAQLNKVSCWTSKDIITKDDCERALLLKRLGVERSPPKPWIRPLFDREFIDI